MILVAAFEPFAGRRKNRAEEASRLLAGARLGGEPVEVARLPVVFARLRPALEQLFARAPKALLLVGESGATRTLQVERLAINVAHARLPDNAGARPIDEEVVRGGEAARRLRADARRLANAAVAAGVPCEVSSHAGTYCCNAAFYLALGLQGERLAPALPDPPEVAFVHVPQRFPWARDRRTARGLAAIAEALLTSAPVRQARNGP